MRRIAIAISSALLSVALVLAPALSVQASPPPVYRGVSVTAPTAGGFNPRIFMLNILGSMLGPVTPSSWRRELLAYNNRFNHSWEQLPALVGMNIPWPADDPEVFSYMTTADPIKAPQTYADYQLKKADMAMKSNVTATGTGPMRVPATKFAGLVKVLGGVGAAVGALQVGLMAGVGISEIAGLDAEAGLCTVGPPFDGTLVSVLAGVDCEAWLLGDEFIANEDVGAGLVAEPACTSSGVCATYVGEVVSGTQRLALFSITGVPDGNSGPYFEVYFQPKTNASGVVSYPAAVQSPYVGSPGGAPSGHFRVPASVFGYEMPVICYSFYSGSTTGVCDATGQGGSTVSESVPDPQRTLNCTITGTDGVAYSSSSEPFLESSGAASSPVCPALPSGVGPSNTTITEDGGGQSHVLYDEDSTDEYLDWQQNRPDCAEGQCKLDLLKLGGTVPVSCFDLEETCNGWFEDPSKSDTYQCQYGRETVDLSECNVYSGVFSPQRVQVGAPYSDPITGEWSGGQSSPDEATGLMAGGVRDPAANRNCWGQGWAEFNPVEWIMRPIQCSLEWAFVPRPVVVQLEGAKVTGSFDERAPGQVAELVGDFNVNPSITGCKIEVPFPIPFTGQDTVVPVIDACEGSYLAPVAAISRGVLLCTTLVLVVVLIRRQISGTVDFKGN